MSKTSKSKWHWIPRPPLGGADGAAAASIFRAGSLSAEDFLARESIQNSWDAAITLRKRNPDSDIPFRMAFRFVDYEGPEKAQMLEAFGITELSKHFINKDGLDQKLLIQVESAFEIVQSEGPLRILYLEDFGTHGLYGVPPHSKSHLYKALYVFGVTGKGEGSGGSFGFGKGAFIRASRSRTIVAYSLFQAVTKGEEFDHDDPTTRRLVGWSWWNQHDIANTSFDGRAVMFSPPHGEGSLPYADIEADDIAQSLGINIRKTAQLKDLGSTLALVDPVIDPHKLLESLEKWWWPALTEHGLNFELEVVLPSGDVLIPRPRMNETLKPFIHAYGLAVGTDVVSQEKSETISSTNWQKIQVSAGALEPGVMALTCAEMHETNLRDSDTGELVTPKVALIRGPRMVIQYYESTGRNLPISGVYLAHESIDSHLRATEPPAHDDWDTKENSDIPKDSTAVAQSVMNKIRNALSKFAQEFAAPPSTTQKPLTHFSKLLGDLFGGNPGPWPPPPPESIPVSIQYPSGVQLKSIGDKEIAASTKVKLSLIPTEDIQSLTCTFSSRFTVFEDDNPSTETVELNVELINGDANLQPDGKWEIKLNHESAIEFQLATVAYSSDWTGRFEPRIDYQKTLDTEGVGSES